MSAQVVIGSDLETAAQTGGEAPLLVIAGPCMIESADMALRTAETLRLIDPPPDAKSFIGYETGFFQVMTCLGLQMIVAAPLVCQIVSSIQTSRAVAANGANAPRSCTT